MSKEIKLYKIWSPHGDLIYIGSTGQTLCRRFANHKSEFRRRKENQSLGCKSYLIFQAYGIDNCKIELIETFEASNIEERRKIEGGYIRNTQCVNEDYKSNYFN